MIPVGTIVKWSVIGMIVVALGVGAKTAYNYHLDEINKAIEQTQTRIVLEQEQARKAFEQELREESKLEKEKIQKELDLERKKVTDLQRMLLIDHDLDRLLQRKPGLILTRVNEGTEEVLKELEELTQ